MESKTAEERLNIMGLALPPAPDPVGVYKPYLIEGNYLYLSGSYADNKMLFTGTVTAADGSKQEQRLTFFRNPDGTVRQLWETSSKPGEWQVAFDGLYRKR